MLSLSRGVWDGERRQTTGSGVRRQPIAQQILAPSLLSGLDPSWLALLLTGLLFSARMSVQVEHK